MNNSINLKHRFLSANIIERIIYINIAIFIVTYILKAGSYLMQWDSNPLFDYFALPAEFNSYLPKFWTLLSYGFLHDGFLHILFNLLILYYLGILFLDFFSKKQFLTYYIAGILVGGLVFLLSYNYFPALSGKSTRLVGASAGVTAIVIGLATKVPHYALHFRFIGAIKLWHIGVFFVLKDIIQLPIGNNTGGLLAHLGGAFIGFILTSQLNDAKGLVALFSNQIEKKKKQPLKTVYKKASFQQTNTEKDEKQKRIDSILDKISNSGYDALSQEEKDFLFSVGKNN